VLVTLDNGSGAATPTTLGPRGLTELHATLTELRDRAGRGEIAAVAVTGAPPHFVAGADLRSTAAIADADRAAALARLGHDTFRLLGELGVPTAAFVNGTALGGGLELALHCTYRTVADDVTTLGLPETRLGLVPGWGGCFLLPHLVGVAPALDLVLGRPAAGRTTTAREAAELGLVDVVLPADGFVTESLAWLDRVLRGALAATRRPPSGAAEWDAAAASARRELDRRLHGAAPAPYRALDLVTSARTADRDAAFAAEDAALTDLLLSEEFRAGRYAFEVTSRAARRAAPHGTARPVTAVGIVGAGTMAAQLSVQVAHRLRVPVTMREVDQERASAGRERVDAQLADLVRGGRLRPGDATAVRDLITIGTDLAALHGADLVIEAVTEVMAVKRQVFAAVADVVAPEAVLATNTSALSVTAIGAGLRHPGRVVGLHFFNPVARMPLVEVVHTASTDDAALAAACDVARRLGKTAVEVADRPGFVVNRVLLRLLAEVAAAVEAGTPVEVADRSLRPLGLPMGPFRLLQLVGLPVALHVLGTLHDELGPRYARSPGLERLAAEGRTLVGPAGADVDPAVQDAFGPAGGAGALDGPGLRDAVLRGLTEEIGLLLDERVVDSAEQVDVCLILGAGWPFHLGGITPYLDRSGWAERVRGRRFHPAGP